MPIIHDQHDVYRMRNHVNRMENPRAMGVLKLIENIYPSLARKLFKSKNVVMQMVMTNMNPTDILDYYVCRQCESLTLGKDGILLTDGFHPQAKCENAGCGATTTDPVTLREWLTAELKSRKAFPELAKLDKVVDYMALGMMNTATIQLEAALMRRFEEQRLAERIGANMDPDDELDEEAAFVHGAEVEEALREIAEEDAEDVSHAL